MQFKIGDIVRSNNTFLNGHETTILRRKESGVNYIITGFERGILGINTCIISFFSSPIEIDSLFKINNVSVCKDYIELDVNYYRKEKFKKLLNNET